MRVLFNIVVISFFTTSCFGQFIYIPDTNLRKALKDLDYTTNDSLDKTRISGVLQLTLANKAIVNCSGLEYFTNLKYLNLSNNNLVKASFLPANLETLNLSHNQIEILEGLSPKLRVLICTNSGVKEIKGLPDSLVSINIYNNNLRELPDWPKSLKYLNYANNPVNINNLGISFQKVECSSPFQNCLPLAMRDFNIFGSPIPEFEELDSIFVRIEDSSDVYKIRLFREKKHFRTDFKSKNSDTLALNEVAKRKFKVDELYYIFKLIENKQPKLSFCIDNNPVIINLADNIDDISIDVNCSHCGLINVSMEFVSSNENFTLTYQFVKSTLDVMLTFNGNRTGQNIQKILSWLYMYQLTHLIIPNENITTKYFKESDLEEIYNWDQKNKM